LESPTRFGLLTPPLVLFKLNVIIKNVLKIIDLTERVLFINGRLKWETHTIRIRFRLNSKCFMFSAGDILREPG
jgi:hypothetical protein